MGKKKMTFEEMVELRKNDHEQFIKTVFENCQNNVFFDGELMLKSVKEVTKNDKKVIVTTDKWIYFTPEEKRTLIDMAKAKWEAEKLGLIKEGNERFERAENHPYLELYENWFSASIICASLDEGQKIPEWLFIKACKLFEKHRETDDILWKSYSFKGFIRWEQVERAMKAKDRSDSRSE